MNTFHYWLRPVDSINRLTGNLEHEIGLILCFPSRPLLRLSRPTFSVTIPIFPALRFHFQFMLNHHAQTFYGLPRVDHPPHRFLFIFSIIFNPHPTPPKTQRTVHVHTKRAKSIIIKSIRSTRAGESANSTWNFNLNKIGHIKKNAFTAHDKPIEFVKMRDVDSCVDRALQIGANWSPRWWQKSLRSVVSSMADGRAGGSRPISTLHTFSYWQTLGRQTADNHSIYFILVLARESVVTDSIL